MQYFKEPSKIQLIVTLMISASMLVVFIYFLLAGAFKGSGNLLWFLLPEAIVWFNVMIGSNYLSNRLPVYSPIEKGKSL